MTKVVHTVEWNFIETKYGTRAMNLRMFDTREDAVKFIDEHDFTRFSLDGDTYYSFKMPGDDK